MICKRRYRARKSARAAQGNPDREIGLQGNRFIYKRTRTAQGPLYANVATDNRRFFLVNYRYITFKSLGSLAERRLWDTVAILQEYFAPARTFPEFQA